MAGVGRAMSIKTVEITYICDYCRLNGPLLTFNQATIEVLKSDLLHESWWLMEKEYGWGGKYINRNDQDLCRSCLSKGSITVGKGL